MTLTPDELTAREEAQPSYYEVAQALEKLYEAYYEINASYSDKEILQLFVRPLVEEYNKWLG